MDPRAWAWTANKPSERARCRARLSDLSANGQRDANQNITLDGVSATDGFKSSMLFVPSIEAMEEFKIQSAVYSAEYGMNSGAQANVVDQERNQSVARPGFEFLRNDAMDARGYFLRRTSQKTS